MIDLLYSLYWKFGIDYDVVGSTLSCFVSVIDSGLLLLSYLLEPECRPAEVQEDHLSTIGKSCRAAMRVAELW
jgi:hypothetical protein